jgi:hypothetical protein
LERPSYIYASALTRREFARRGRRRSATGPFTSVSALLAGGALAAVIAYFFGA